MEQIFIAESFRFTARLDWGSDFSMTRAKGVDLTRLSGTEVVS